MDVACVYCLCLLLGLGEVIVGAVYCELVNQGRGWLLQFGFGLKGLVV
jgi:hypothetical protein